MPLVHTMGEGATEVGACSGNQIGGRLGEWLPLEGEYITTHPEMCEPLASRTTRRVAPQRALYEVLYGAARTCVEATWSVGSETRP